MNNFNKCIDLLFRCVSPNDILEGFFHIGKKTLSENIDQQMFSVLALSRWSPQYTDDEVGMVYQWLKQRGEKGGVFDLLGQFAQNTLVEEDGEPLCRYEHLLEWNELSRKLGEDIFTTTFMAYNDFKASRERCYFSWPPIISTNNIRLKHLLAKGLAENHFHLKGSSPHFSLSWISLMNRFTNRREVFQRLEKKTRLEPEIVNRFTGEIPNLYALVKKAACIRAFLFSLLTYNRVPCPLMDKNPTCSLLIKKLECPLVNEKPGHSLIDRKVGCPLVGMQYLSLLKPGWENELDIFIHHIQKDVELLKYELGKRFCNEVPDYAIPKNLVSVNYNGNTLLYGERYFLYAVFKEIFGQNRKGLSQYRELFYAYLTIKERLRQEFVQVNDRIGFQNFQKYQDRKEWFIPRGSIYEKALYYMAVNTSIKNQNIVSFETRISPANTKEELGNNIKRIDGHLKARDFDDENYNELDGYLKSEAVKKTKEKERELTGQSQFYTLHFIKRSDPPIRQWQEEKLLLTPRDNRMRKWVKQQAFAIMGLRKSLSPVAARILGIDAASSEIGCRPEVFAQTFRFLKGHFLGEKYDLFEDNIKTKIEKLGATYHVGEDFLDMADGLRAIDEAVKFLALTHGDRLGHALALGADPFDYYEMKQNRVILPKQDLLDNIVWMLSRIRKYALGDFPQLVYRLEEHYYRLFSEIYLNNLDEQKNEKICPHTLYYDAWRLRGDDPMAYINEKYDPRPTLTYWQRCGRNDAYPKEGNIRNDKNITCIYHQYHFNPVVKKIGMEKEEFPVEKNYARAVSVIQKEMQKEIRESGIGIETNPSSNYLIGCFRNYSKHPLIAFFNLGLTADNEEIKSCPQLFVSINTDDQGVFNTYLEKEYALMALALEKKEDQKGNKVYNSAMIYDWLDRIRQMGLQQSFR